MSKDYEKGYADGYLEGFRQGLSSGIQNTKKQVHPYKFEVGCRICGIGKNGEPFGVSCQHPDCPLK